MFYQQYLLINKDGFIVSEINNSILDSIDVEDEKKPEYGMRIIDTGINPVPKNIFKPKWVSEEGKWEEGQTHEEKILTINSIKKNKIEVFRREVEEKCYNIASSEEQRNWILWPEDYEESEIENLKNLIMEKRKIYRDFKNKVEECEDIFKLIEIEFPNIS